MTYKVTEEGNVSTVFLNGEIDRDVTESAKEVILPLIEAGKEVHLNLKDVSYMDSSGISVGEQTGQLDEMFNSVAMYYEEEFDGAVDNMSSLIEPIMIVFMGLMIGGLMIAMYSPIFNVGALIN